MNILQRLAAVFAEPKAEDMVMHFVVAHLQTSAANLLVTDPEMQSAYARLASTLACAYNGELLPIESDMDRVTGGEAIVIHSTFNPSLVKRVALRVTHLILVVEYFDTSACYAELLADIEVECGCKIDFAFIEEGCGAVRPYSPTESHYLGHKIRRMVRQEL